MTPFTHSTCPYARDAFLYSLSACYFLYLDSFPQNSYIVHSPLGSVEVFVQKSLFRETVPCQVANTTIAHEFLNLPHLPSDHPVGDSTEPFCWAFRAPLVWGWGDTQAISHPNGGQGSAGPEVQAETLPSSGTHLLGRFSAYHHLQCEEHWVGRSQVRRAKTISAGVTRPHTRSPSTSSSRPGVAASHQNHLGGSLNLRTLTTLSLF